MTLYIDNLLISTVIIIIVKKLKKTFHRKFKIKDFGKVEVIINIYIRRNRKIKILLIN